MKPTLHPAVRGTLTAAGLLFSFVVLNVALVSIQGSSGDELSPMLGFLSASFAVAFGVGAAFVFAGPDGLRAAAAFGAAGVLGGVSLALGAYAISIYESQLRELTDGGPLGIFLLGTVVVALGIALATGTVLFKVFRRR